MANPGRRVAVKDLQPGDVISVTIDNESQRLTVKRVMRTTVHDQHGESLRGLRVTAENAFTQFSTAFAPTDKVTVIDAPSEAPDEALTPDGTNAA